MVDKGFHLQLMTKSSSTKVYRDKGKTLLLLLVAGGFVGACFVFFIKEAGTGKIPYLKEFFLWSAFGISALLLFANVVSLFDRRPAMEFLEAGLLAPEISSEVIPWSAIREVSSRTNRSAKYLELHIDIDKTRGMRWSWRYMVLGPLNRVLGYPHPIVIATMLNHDVDYLIRLTNHYLEKHRTENG